jgi:hypothetical protein
MIPLVMLTVMTLNRTVRNCWANSSGLTKDVLHVLAEKVI